jgi:hypothetical protein
MNDFGLKAVMHPPIAKLMVSAAGKAKAPGGELLVRNFW